MTQSMDGQSHASSSSVLFFVQLSLLRLANSNLTDSELNNFSSQLLQAVKIISFSGDIPEIVDIIQDVVDLLGVAMASGEEIPDSFTVRVTF